MRIINTSEMIDKAKFNGFFKSIVAICMITTLCDGFDINIFGLIIPTLMKDWKIGPAQIGILASWGMFGMIFGSMVFGPLADAIGKRKSILLGTFGYVLFTCACGFTYTTTAMAIFRFIAGFCLAGIYPLAVAFTSEYSPKPIRSRLTVWVTSGMASGTVIAALVGIAIIGPYGWRSMFYASGLIVLLLIAQWFMPESIAFLKKKGQNDQIAKILVRIDPDFKPSSDDEYQLEKKAQTKGSFSNLFTGGFAKNTILFWFMMGASYIFIYGVLMWLPKLMTMKGFTLTGSLFFVMTWNLGFLLGIPVFGYLQDKLGGKRTLQIGWILEAILVCFIGLLNAPTALAIVLFLTGACQHGVSGVAGSYLAQSYPTSFRATGTTWGYAMGRIGGTAGPMIGGFLLARQLPVTQNLMFFAMFPIIGMIFASFTTDFFKVQKEQAAAGR